MRFLCIRSHMYTLEILYIHVGCTLLKIILKVTDEA